MLFISLIVSLVVLILVNAIIARSAWPLLGTLAVSASVTICPFAMMMFSAAVALQALLLLLSTLILLWPRRGRLLYRPLSVVSTVIASLIVSIPALQKQNEYAQLREEFPFETIETRLVSRPPTADVKIADFEHLNKIERELEGADYPRSIDLKSLHEHSVGLFINAPGFGITRIYRGHLSKDWITHSLQDTSPIPQPDYQTPFVSPAGPRTEKLIRWNSDRMTLMHDNSVFDFVNAQNFGFIKDRQHVAGFQRHGMTKVPTAEKSEWVVARVDLVGLVIHETPVAYVSANLPRMDELREAPTRSLDAFEVDALESLKKGEDLIARGTDDKARMLGAIRATKQCIACHGGSRGDMLGAFSYGLRREGKSTEP